MSVCMSVTTSLAHLVAKSLKFWTWIGFKVNKDAFKLSRFHQECFVKKLCCDLFGTASASRPYSSLRTSSHALDWDPEWVLIFEGCLFSWGAYKHM